MWEALRYPGDMKVRRLGGAASGSVTREGLAVRLAKLQANRSTVRGVRSCPEGGRQLSASVSTDTSMGPFQGRFIGKLARSRALSKTVGDPFQGSRAHVGASEN